MRGVFQHFGLIFGFKNLLLQKNLGAESRKKNELLICRNGLKIIRRIRLNSLKFIREVFKTLWNNCNRNFFGKKLLTIFAKMFHNRCIETLLVAIAQMDFSSLLSLIHIYLFIQSHETSMWLLKLTVIVDLFIYVFIHLFYHSFTWCIKRFLRVICNCLNLFQ